MMPETLEYLLRLTVVWAALLALYYLAWRTLPFRWQRAYLLLTLLAGVIIPLLPSLGNERVLPALAPIVDYVSPVLRVDDAPIVANTPEWSWEQLLPFGYLLGTILIGARTLVQWGRLKQWLRDGERSTHGAYPVVLHPGITAPFAALGYIFLPAASADPALTRTALIHEAAHLRSRHHYDTILLTLGSLLLWFHPLYWVLRRQLMTVHEYEADAAVIQRVPMRTYGLQLLQSSLGPAGFPGLFSSPLKQRIMMLTNKNPRQRGRFLPILGLLVMLLGLTVACSDAGTDIVPDETATPATIATDDKFTSARFREGLDDAGNNRKLLEAIYTEIRYPSAARASGVTGLYRAVATLAKNGSLKDIEVAKESEANMAIPPSGEPFVIVGYGSEGTAKAGDGEAAIKTEIARTLQRLSFFQPVLRNGVPIESKLVYDFQYKLE